MLNTKTFKRFVFMVGVFCISLFSSWANMPLYEVKDIHVEVSGDSTLAARDNAIKEAQTKAFHDMIARLVSPSEQGVFSATKPEILEDLVQDFEIIDERFSKTRYSATFIVRFKPDSITQIIRAAGIQPAAQADHVKTLVLPVVEDEKGQRLWANDSAWWLAWGNYGRLEQHRFILPQADAQDRKSLSNSWLDNITARDIEPLLSRYGADRVLIASQIFDHPTPHIDLKILDRQGHLRQERMQFSAKQLENLPHLVEEVAEVASNTNSLGISPVKSARHEVIARFLITSHAQWQKALSSVRHLVGSHNVTPVFLSKNEARVRILFEGSTDELEENLAAMGLKVTLETTSPAVINQHEVTP